MAGAPRPPAAPVPGTVPPGPGEAPRPATGRPPEASRIWAWLDQVPDPEIPVVSLVDLGIVRDVQIDGGTVVITITPTYSGCPATRVIADDIRRALHEKGVEDLRVETRLSPAWTTDWITAKGRQALERYGIAPPAPGGARGGRPACCPRCGGTDLERVAEFGSTPCKALWRCRGCREPFDYFKCI